MSTQIAVFGVGMLIGLAIIVGLLLTGGRLFGVRLETGRVILSCLAATAANVIVSLIATPLLSAAFTSIFNQGVAMVLNVLIGYLIGISVLAVCLAAIAMVPQRIGWALGLFANGGAIVGSGLVLMFLVGTTTEAVSEKSAAWILIGVGLILLVAGYLLGVGQGAPSPSITGVTPGGAAVIMASSGDSGRTIAPVTIPGTGGSRHGGEERLTEGSRETVLPSEKVREATGAWLVLTIGKEKGKKYELTTGDAKIGKGSGCPIRITGDDEISREHSLIRYSGGRYEVNDLASTNGTWLNGSRVNEARSLQDGDKIGIGQSQLTFKKV